MSEGFFGRSGTRRRAWASSPWSGAGRCSARPTCLAVAIGRCVAWTRMG